MVYLKTEKVICKCFIFLNVVFLKKIINLFILKLPKHGFKNSFKCQFICHLKKNIYILFEIVTLIH